ncbi:MAG TPA: type IV pilus assembly protein PilM [Solirubrobacteraceae bacterium]|nr:type IV pilus assembly protein PilM [Solirubrobacteraceae bacterium]
MQLGLPHRGRDGGVLVGLDIQPGSAVAVRVARNGRLHVEEAVGVALPAGVVREGEVIDSEALGAALRTMFDGSKLPRRVRVGIAGQRCVMRTLEVPPLKDKKELAQAVAFTASQEMPMPLESALTDFQSLGQVETKTGPRERIVFVAAHQEPVGKLLDALRRAGLTAGGLDLSAFALIRSLHEPSANGASDGCKLYVNVDGLTNIAIADDTTCLFTRAATVGAESMAGELAGARSIPLEQARGELVTTNLLDLENDQTVDARTVLRDGLRDVAAEVRAALDFHSSQEGEPVTGLVLSGALAQVRGFADELGQTLGYDVTVREVDAGDGATVTPCRLAVAAGLSVAEVAQ